MTYPTTNQFYPQQNNYMYPQYAQAQQRQEQLNQVFANYTYNFTRDRAEAENWPIAPGNTLVFKDQNNMYFYTKSLGYNPNEKPTFVIYKREDCVEPIQQNAETAEQNPLKDELEKYQSSTKLEIDNLRSSIEELKELINQKPSFNNGSNKPYKKGGRDQ